MVPMVLVWGLALALLQPACEGSSMGAVVHVVPMDSTQGQTVRAHFTVVAPAPCPDLSGACASGESCTVYPTSLLLSGAQPSPGWCVRQWHKTVPSHYNATITLGSSVTFYVSVKATPTVRPNNGRLNQPPYVALPPPLRARKGCLHHFHLEVKDLDGDKVRCRFPRPAECDNCALHTFIELDQEQCMVTFTGHGEVGHYSIVVMVEDHYPAPKTYVLMSNQALSSVPVHLSLTVEQSSTLCSAEPMASSQTPRENALLPILPYEQVDMTVGFISQLESVSEIAVVGPPALFRSQLSTAGSLTSMKLTWVRGPNSLAPLVPICFSANTNSLQSEPRCVWLYQRQIESLPTGAVLTCQNTEMSLVLPVTSLTNIALSELQLNSATCPVTYNSTHLTALIPLTGCGTKKVHSGNELVYTNTLQSVRRFTMVTRQPRLVLPLACRIPGLVASGPHYNVSIPTERQAFGAFVMWLEFHMPGEGPRASFTRHPRFHHLHLPRPERKRRDVSSSSSAGSGNGTTSTTSSPAAGGGNATTASSQGALGSKLNYLDLHVMSNCSINRAELIVGNCMEAETEDMANGHVLMDQGCSSSDSTLEVISSPGNSKIYRLDLSTMKANGTAMYIECTVYLCITMMPSQTCPSQCGQSSRAMQDSVFSSSYTVRSGAVSLVVTTPAPAIAAVTVPVTTAATATPAPPAALAPAATDAATAVATAAATTAATTAAAADAATAATTAAAAASRAPQVASSITLGVLLIAVCIFLN